MRSNPDLPQRPDRAIVTRVLDEVLGWSAEQQWRGWNKHDGLNSPLLRAVLGWGRWPRMVAIQGVMRCPVNLRPVLLVPKVYNPKGLALFARACLTRYETVGSPDDLDTARSLLALLERQTSDGDWSGTCWGYHYPWQDPAFYAPSGTPNAVVTAFVCEAFLHAHRVTGEAHWLDVVTSASQFLAQDLPVLRDTDGERCLGYMPLPMDMRVMDVSILVASALSQLDTQRDSDDYRELAERLARYVVNRQTAEGAWFYTDPPSASRIRHDNYHTGFILDALDRYMRATGDRQWQPAYEHGLAFYAEHLFNRDGSPRWMADQDYPHDIHGAAQGILTFSRHAGEWSGLAERVLGWSLEHMYHPAGRFYYQRRRLHTRRFTLLRWCNAWMAFALASWLRATASGR